MKSNWYVLIIRALDEGAQIGWNHAQKHTDTPEPDAVQQAIVDEQVTQLCEIINFDDVLSE